MYPVLNEVAAGVSHPRCVCDVTEDVLLSQTTDTRIRCSLSASILILNEGALDSRSNNILEVIQCDNSGESIQQINGPTEARSSGINDGVRGRTFILTNIGKAVRLHSGWLGLFTVNGRTSEIVECVGHNVNLRIQRDLSDHLKILIDRFV